MKIVGLAIAGLFSCALFCAQAEELKPAQSRGQIDVFTDHHNECRALDMLEGIAQEYYHQEGIGLAKSVSGIIIPPTQAPGYMIVRLADHTRVKSDLLNGNLRRWTEKLSRLEKGPRKMRVVHPKVGTTYVKETYFSSTQKFLETLSRVIVNGHPSNNTEIFMLPKYKNHCRFALVRLADHNHASATDLLGALHWGLTELNKLSDTELGFDDIANRKIA